MVRVFFTEPFSGVDGPGEDLRFSIGDIVSFFFFAFGSWLCWEYLIDLLVGKRGEESNVKFNVSPLWQSGIINWGGIVTRGRALIK